MNNLIARIHTGVSIPMVFVQFSFSNRKIVPFSLPWRPNETAAEAANRNNRHTGKQTVEPVAPVYADNLYNLLWWQGYRLVEAWAQERRKGGKASIFMPAALSSGGGKRPFSPGRKFSRGTLLRSRSWFGKRLGASAPSLIRSTRTVRRNSSSGASASILRRGNRL